MSAAGDGRQHRAAAETRYMQAIHAHRVLPTDSEYAEARCRAWAAIKVAERDLVGCLWKCGELAQVPDLGRFFEKYCLALQVRAA